MRIWHTFRKPACYLCISMKIHYRVGSSYFEKEINWRNPSPSPNHILSILRSPYYPLVKLLKYFHPFTPRCKHPTLYSVYITSVHVPLRSFWRYTSSDTIDTEPATFVGLSQVVILLALENSDSKSTSGCKLCSHRNSMFDMVGPFTAASQYGRLSTRTIPN